MSSGLELSLIDAADALDTLAAGIVPNRTTLLSGALALNSLCLRGTPDRELIDTAAGLDAMATGQTFDLDDAGRARAARLAERVRREATPALNPSKSS